MQVRFPRLRHQLLQPEEPDRRPGVGCWLQDAAEDCEDPCVSRLSSSDGFSEETSDGVCTQYTTADCSKYWDCVDSV